MRRIQAYSNCPECGNASLAVLKNGRLVRHEPGLGSVFPKKWYQKHPGFKQTICKGSGLKVMERVADVPKHVCTPVSCNNGPWAYDRCLGCDKVTNVRRLENA